MAENALTFERLAAELESYGKALADLYVANLIDSDRVASRKLIDSVTARVEGGDGGTYDVVLYLENYWKYIEDGTRPHRPPYSKILEWVRVKPVIPRPDENGRIPKPESIAWAITKKIERDGTDGSHDLERSIDDLFPVFYPRILQALTEDIEGGLRRFILQTFDELRA